MKQRLMPVIDKDNKVYGSVRSNAHKKAIKLLTDSGINACSVRYQRECINGISQYCFQAVNDNHRPI
jgi:hypothetical protein